MNKKYVLISVFNKDGIVEYAQELIKLGYTIVSSGGTATHLAKHGIEVIDVQVFTKMPAILGHRVVTLHPAVHAGLLAKDNAEHRAELEKLGFPFFDMLVVDFYPLQEEIKKEDATTESIIEKIDIGGPTMAKAAAKAGRIVVCKSDDRQTVLDWIIAGQPEREKFVQNLAGTAFSTVVNYYTDAAQFFMGLNGVKV